MKAEGGKKISSRTCRNPSSFILPPSPGLRRTRPPSAFTAVLGVGVDIVETTRIRGSLAKFGDRFLNRCFLPGEVAYCRQMKFPELHFAARFAAKEALSKAFGTGIGKQLGWKDIEIRKRDSGEPYAVLHGKGAALARARGVTEIFVSLSNCRDYSAAQAVIVGRSTTGKC